MAPGFLSKFAKATTATISATRPSGEGDRSRGSSPGARTRAMSASAASSSPVSSFADTEGPDVLVEPPSPRETSSASGASAADGEQRRARRAVTLSVATGDTGSQDSLPESTPKPNNGLLNPGGRSPRASPLLRHSSSTPDLTPTPNGHGSNGHGRFVTEALSIPVPKLALSSDDESDPLSPPSAQYAHMTPIVESPTATRTEFVSPQRAATLAPKISSSFLAAPQDDDGASVYSATTGKKKRPWRRATSRDPPATRSEMVASPPASPKSGRRSERKPTGLAAAIAASGMSLANPALSMPTIQASLSTPTDKGNGSAGAQQTRSPRRSGSMSSANRHSIAQQHAPRTSLDATSPTRGEGTHSRRTSMSDAPPIQGSSLPGSEYDSASQDEDSSSELDLDDDIPVTGFAVASSKRNQDFHDLFPDIPKEDYLIEDYGCALARDILVQGRLYISENHLCFHANIFGWITDLCIPIYEITALEKKMTALIIPNAIQVNTRDAKYTFASFMSRDTTYDVIFNVWRLVRPSSALASATNSGRASPVDGASRAGMDSARRSISTGGGGGGGAAAAPVVRKATSCACGKARQHFSETALDVTFPGTPEKIYNLMFASGFIKDFMRDNQKLMDIQISDWQPDPASQLLSRNMSYIKPLNGSIGPKQTKCELKDETMHFDIDDYISTVTTTRTPEVPSGGVFSVKTRTCITWANAVSARVLVTTQVDWTGRSFIKGIIEKSALDGQMTYHKTLEAEMRSYIHQHTTEFVPIGVDPAAVEEQAVTTPSIPEPSRNFSTEDPQVARERERRYRAVQLVYDTFEGAYNVAKRSTEGALDLLSDGWDNSSGSTILYLVIIFLLLSNIYTLARMGKREEAGRRKALKYADQREQLVQKLVTTLWDELSSSKSSSSYYAPPAIASAPTEWKGEMDEMNKALDAIEARIKGLRQSLTTIEHQEPVHPEL